MTIQGKRKKKYQGDKVEDKDVEPRGLSVDVHKIHVCCLLSIVEMAV